MERDDVARVEFLRDFCDFRDGRSVSTEGTVEVLNLDKALDLERLGVVRILLVRLIRF